MKTGTGSPAGFRHQYGPWALVAGAAAGIGEAWARALAAKGLNLVLVALEDEALNRLASDLHASHGIEVRPLSADLADPATLARVRELAGELEIGLLVYNACYSVIGEICALSLEDKQRMVAVNCAGPINYCDALLPNMLARQRGGVVLMSSLSSQQGSAMVGTYAATKAFDTIFGESLWCELEGTGVDVLTVMAGATRTPGFLGVTPEDRQSRVFPMTPEQVVQTGLRGLGRKPVVIPGVINRLVYGFTRYLMTRRMAARFISKNTRALYQSQR